MDGPSSSECIAAVGGNNYPGSVCVGIRMGDQRGHQHVCENTSRRKTVETRTFFVRVPYLHLEFKIARLL